MIKNILYKPVVHILIIIVICIVSYSNTFHVPFVFDGLEGIVENPVIKDLHYFIEPFHDPAIFLVDDAIRLQLDQ